MREFVIKLPQLHWRFFFSLPFLVVAALLIGISSFAYWYQNIRPFFWVPTAHLETFSTLLSSDGAGRILEMGPSEGDFVRKGDTLFVLDAEAVRGREKQAKRTLDSIYVQMEADKERIAKAMEGYLSASADLDLGIGSVDQVQKQLAMMEEAQQRVDGAEKKIEQAKEELCLIDLEMKKLHFAAPFDGLVLKRTKNPGAVVLFGDPIYILSDPSQVWIEAEIPEKELGRVKIGTLAKIQLPAYPNRELGGKVSFIGPASVAKTSLLPFSAGPVMIPIKISVESTTLSLRPGLSAHVGLKVR